MSNKRHQEIVIISSLCMNSENNWVSLMNKTEQTVGIWSLGKVKLPLLRKSSIKVY